MDNSKRLSDHLKNTSLEEIFKEITPHLEQVEKKLISEFTIPKLPVVLICGCARSGTTLLYQLLAKTGLFSYPTNIVSRFYYAPYLGMKIQQLLYDFDSKNEIFPTKNFGDLRSDLGKTYGPVEPHEFWYFWNRFFDFSEENQKLESKMLERVDKKLFLKEIASMEIAMNKPVLLKAMKLNWNLSFLSEMSNNFFFVNLVRDELYNAQSLLLAREKFFGKMDEWYSLKPPEFSTIKKLAPEYQVIEQVRVTNRAISSELEMIDNGKQITISYEDLCLEPELTLKKILKKIGIEYSSLSGYDNIELNERVSLKPDMWDRMKNYAESNI